MEEQVNKEINEVQEARIEQIKEPKVRLPITSKNNRNHSGAKTSPATVLFDANQKAQKVILDNTVFPASEKWAFGFVASGVSIRGAIECSENEGEIRCHDCGEWFAALGNHIAKGGRFIKEHSASVVEYKMRHSLKRGISLSAPQRRRKFALNLNPELRNNGISKTVREAAKSVTRSSESGGASQEIANLRFACMAQLTVRINAMAIGIGHTPTRRELMAGDGKGRIHASTIRWAFNMTVREALRSIGLEVRRRGGGAKHPTQCIAYPDQLKIQQLRANGLGFREIGRQLGVSHTTVRSYAHTHPPVQSNPR